MNRATHPHQVHPTVIKQQYDTQNVWEFENQWRTSFCTCTPFGRCCFACFCTPCMGWKLASHLGETPICGCCIPCALFYFRAKIRTARRIDGSCCGDFCVAHPCCCGCTATQIANELETQGMWDAPKPKKQRKQPRHDRSREYD